MASLTHTVGGTDNLVNFKSAARVPIESLKCHFAPIQDGEGDPSPENVRPIRGWNGVEVYKTGKNIGHIVGYSATSTSSPTSNRNLSGSYGNTINTTNPDQSVTITQTQYDETVSVNHYKNGYFVVIFDNLKYDEVYDISFKVTNILNNPLNVALNRMSISATSGTSSYSYVSQVIDNIVIFKNLTFKQYFGTERMDMAIYNCGMSCTISDIMVTPVGMNDGVFEPYCGERLPIIFPITGKNKFNSLDATNLGYLSYDSDTNTFINTIEDTRSTLEIYCEGWANTTSDRIASFFSRYQVPVGHFTHTFTITNPLFENMNYLRLKHNGSKKDFSFFVPLKLIVGQTYTLSMDITGADPTTVGGVSFKNIQIELGSEATEYTEYNSDNTVYGGYIDIAKGELVATKLYLEIPLSEFTKTEYEDRDAYVIREQNFGHRIVRNSNLKSNIAKYQWNMPHEGAITKFFSYSLDNSEKSSIYMSLPKNTDETIDFEMVADLETPIIYPLNKTYLTAFLGQNNFWSNTNSITEVSYAVYDSALIRTTRSRIMNYMQQENKKWQTIPKIMEEGVYWSRTQDIKSINENWCITQWYDININNRIMLRGYIGQDSSSITFQYYFSDDSWDFWYFNAGDTEGTRAIGKANVILTRISFSINKSHIEDCYVIIEETGQILFAGKKSPYYGYTNINEMPTIN